VRSSHRLRPAGGWSFSASGRLPPSLSASRDRRTGIGRWHAVVLARDSGHGRALSAAASGVPINYWADVIWTLHQLNPSLTHSDLVLSPCGPHTREIMFCFRFQPGSRTTTVLHCTVTLKGWLLSLVLVVVRSVYLLGATVLWLGAIVCPIRCGSGIGRHG
jgi:hypothetical protein